MKNLDESDLYPYKRREEGVNSMRAKEFRKIIRIAESWWCETCWEAELKKKLRKLLLFLSLPLSFCERRTLDLGDQVSTLLVSKDENSQLTENKSG